jgi:hypothetical protein
MIPLCARNHEEYQQNRARNADLFRAAGEIGERSEPREGAGAEGRPTIDSWS